MLTSFFTTARFEFLLSLMATVVMILVFTSCAGPGTMRRALRSARAATVAVPGSSTERLVDTLVQQVADSSVLRALFECDSLGQVRLRELHEVRGEMAAQQLAFEDGRLEVITRWRTRVVDRIHEVRDTVTVIELRDVVREVRHVPQFFWWCFGIALAAVGWVAVRLFMK